MTLSRTSRWLIAVLLIIVVAGTWLARTYFSSTNTALRHAEAFLFRRMTVAELADQGTFRFFFATNRTIQDITRSVENQFGNERQPQLSYGIFDTTIEPHLGLGMIINPTDWFQNEEIQVSQMFGNNQSRPARKRP